MNAIKSKIFSTMKKYVNSGRRIYSEYGKRIDDRLKNTKLSNSTYLTLHNTLLRILLENV
jgi:hypothetical protein